MEIHTNHYSLRLNDATGALESFAATELGGQELLAPGHAALPLFTIQYLDAQRRLHRISSDAAARCELRRSDLPAETLVDLAFHGLGNTGIDVRVRLRCPADDQCCYWSLALSHPSNDTITTLQFPIVVAPYHYGEGEQSALVVPSHVGVVYQHPRPEELQPDTPDAWELLGPDPYFNHYPGTLFAQFLAYYTSRHGLYLAAYDTEGGVKLIKPVHHPHGLRLGIAHAVAWDAPGEHQLGYEVALGMFAGDWYDAADLYRAWYEKSPLVGSRLVDRRDLPSWLMDSPLHVVLRVQGQIDEGPAAPNPEFVPYSNALPLLDRLAGEVEAPLTPIIMSWERPGPWVYPDSFPVAGGDDALRAFTAATRERGWHVGTYCNGTRWVIQHKWTGYDGTTFFERNRGEQTVCRLPDNTLRRSLWDRHWRPSYECCVAVPQTQTIALDYVRHLLDLGLDWIQFLDQNVGAMSHPCYSAEHGHAPAPGPWMTTAMATLLDQIEQLPQTREREIVWSVEDAPNDFFRPRFHICDIRPHLPSRHVPLYTYLFHEYILTQAAFSVAPNPYWMQIKTAYSFVMGDLLTAIMGPGGRLMNWAGHPWATWDTSEGDQAGMLVLLKRALALRRGPGRDFLVYGRLLRPVAIRDIEEVEWVCEQHVTKLASVLHARWQAPDGRTALALANWTTEERQVRIDLPPTASVYLAGHTLDSYPIPAAGEHTLKLAPLSAALVEYAAGDRSRQADNHEERSS